MAKKGMKHYYTSESNNSKKHPTSDIKSVPEIQGKAKHGNKKAGPIH